MRNETTLERRPIPDLGLPVRAAAAMDLLLIQADDEAARTRRLLDEGGEGPYRLFHAASLARGLARLKAGRAGTVLLDLDLPDCPGLEALARVREAAPRAPVVCLAGRDRRGLAAETLRRGAQDCLDKERVDSEALDRSLRLAVERESLRAELEKRCQSAAELGRIREQLVRVVSHEFSNAISVVQCALGFLETTEASKRPSSSRLEMYDILRRNVHELDMVTTNLLSLGKIESRRIGLKPARTDAAALLKESLERFQVLYRNKRLDVRLEAEEIPPLRAEPEALSLVFSNLLMNAIKYTPEGGEIRIGLSLDDGLPGRALIFFKDTGIGMSSEERRRLFSGFFRGESAKKAARGFGIGLALVRSILELHGSSLKVASARGKGSTFSFHLPVCDAVPTSS